MRQATRQRSVSAVADAAHMNRADPDRYIHQLIGGDASAAADILDRARTSDQPILLVAAALIDPAAHHLLVRARDLAANTRDRQLVAIAAAHVTGDRARVDALARDHLVDYPDSVLVAWIAAAAITTTPLPTRSQEHQETDQP
jgi:hypothetical protein